MDNTKTCDDIFVRLKRNELEWTIPSFITALIKAGRKPLLEDVDIYSVESIETYDDANIVLDYGEKEFPNNVISKDILIN